MAKAARLEVWLGVIASLGAAAALLPLVIGWSHLPELIATHWGFRGAPNGFMSRGLALAVFGGGMALATALSWPRRRAPLRDDQAARLVGMLAGSSALLVWASGLCVWANWDRAHWSRAAHVSLALVMVSLVVPLAVGAMVARFARNRGLGLGRAPHAAATPAVELAPGERVYWTSSAENPAFAWFALGTAVLALILLVAGSRLPAASMAFVALLTEHCSRIRVTLSAQRLTVRYGRLGWVRQHVPIERILGASTFELVPLAHGGWGYRGSLAVFGRAAIIVRRGLALRLALVKGRLFTITVDDAKSAAELVNGLIERRARSGSDDAAAEGYSLAARGG